MAKLERITQLSDGWDGPNSLAIQDVAVEWYTALIDRFQQQVPADLEPMPTPSGGLRMEWDRGEVSFVAEIEGNGGMFICLVSPREENDFEAELQTVDLDKLYEFYVGSDHYV